MPPTDETSFLGAKRPTGETLFLGAKRPTTDEEKKKTEGRLSPVGQLPSTMAVVISLFLPGRGIVHHGHGFLQKKNNN